MCLLSNYTIHCVYCIISTQCICSNYFEKPFDPNYAVGIGSR